MRRGMTSPADFGPTLFSSLTYPTSLHLAWQWPYPTANRWSRRTQHDSQLAVGVTFHVVNRAGSNAELF